MPIISSVSGNFSPIGRSVKEYNSATGGTTATFISSGKQYRSHTFTAGTSNFVVAKAAQPFEVLLVGGGGSGGGSSVMFTTVGGGGGGGALLYGTMGVSPNGSARLLTPTTYQVVVGAGAGPGNYSGSNGGNTTFDGLTALGGGGGSGEYYRAGSNGGSGGGCWIGQSTIGAGAGTSGQGGDGGYNQSGASGGSALHMPVTIRGTSESFGIGAAVSGWGSSPSNLGSGGIGVWMQQYGESGKGGIAIITYEIAP